MKKMYVSPLFRSSRKQNVLLRFEQGAKLHGYELVSFTTMPKDMKEDDILLLWNRHVKQDSYAKKFEEIGAKVFTFENPYIKLGRNKDEAFISCGLGWHNNIKYAPKQRDNGERWKSFNIELKPWKTNGKHILITTQGKSLDWPGLGHESYRQPSGWDTRICNLVRSMSKREILFRQHPNGFRTDYEPLTKIKNLKISTGKVAIKNDLVKAWCTIVYTSNSATESLINGVPVFYTGPTIFLKDLCLKELNMLEKPFMPTDREKYFKHLAWAQYSLKEVQNGYMFESLLG